jgi:hypothetical protein
MHLGHAFCAWFPFSYARRIGGTFTVIPNYAGFRIHDLDNQSYSWEICVARFSEDLNWLGYEHALLDTKALWPEYVAAGNRLGYRMPWHDYENIGMDIGSVRHPFEDFDGVLYDPWVVVASCMDYETARSDAMWRGLDRLASAQLYADVALRLGYRPPVQQFVPTVWREGNTRKESKSEIGGTTVRSLRDAGYTPLQVTDTLRELHRRWKLIPQWERTPHIVIPAGLLTPDTVGALEYQGEWARCALAHANTEWAQDVARCAERVRQERVA